MSILGIPSKAFPVAMLTLAIALSALAYSFGGSRKDLFGLLILGFLPGFPYALLGLLSFWKNHNVYRSISGALVGAFIASIPHFLFFISPFIYSGGGANIGLGFTIMASPILFLLFMLAGAVASKSYRSSSKAECLLLSQRHTPHS